MVHVGGRVVFVRNTGKLCFATLQGGTEGKRIQAMLSLAEVGESPWPSGSPWLTWVTTCS